MEIEIVSPDQPPLHERCFIGFGILKSFRGHNDVEIHIFRAGATVEEMEKLKEKDLVGKADPSTPPEVLAGATEEAALSSILECFTEEESEQIARYLEKRYGEQLRKLLLCPIDLPVPLGLGPLAAYPQSKNSGFINFDEAPNYPLPFRIKAYYELK